ncbi:bifunctional folylpolyglutamate synthase/dihydrofolate synthase [Lysinibacillus sp. 54212]|uniref:bifunctional folylpolyglutamate synthase/dihydrofolate synthase n=1 Tax=Lysinibacillus sp. 54212 TaxID=3119829 RepID=UPI002FC7761A
MIPGLDRYKEAWQVESDREIKPGLHAMREALLLLGQPHHNMPFVHLAGTNGKGSTLTFIERIARSHGLKVGKFMSPCIVDVHDQIQINGEPIHPAQMDALFKRMASAGLSGKLTDFELLTCTAFLHFLHEGVDLALIEAGMGGREDSTNVILPIVSVIPSIALEHTNFLGDTLQSIAMHKAGIIKSGTPVVIGELPEEAKLIIEQEAAFQNAELFAIHKHFCIEDETYSNNKTGLKISHLKRRMLGKHQGHNMAIAITAFLAIGEALQKRVSIDAIRSAVSCATVPGRFEEVLPQTFFDGAHNPASAAKLVDTLRESFPQKDIHFVIGMLRDKDVGAVLKHLEQVGTSYTFVDFSNERAMPAKTMLELSRSGNSRVTNDCLPYLLQPREENELVVVTGSLYLLTELRTRLLDNKRNM